MLKILILFWNRILRAVLIFGRWTVTVTICKQRSTKPSWATKGAWTLGSSLQMLTLSYCVWVLSTLTRRRSDNDKSGCFCNWSLRWATQLPGSDFELSVRAGQSCLPAGLWAVSILPDLAGTRSHVLPGKTHPPFPYNWRAWKYQLY